MLYLGFNLNASTQTLPQKLGWKFCVGSYTFKLFAFSQALEKVDSLGVKYIEMWNSQKIGGGIEGITSFSMDKSTQQAILELCAKHGIKIISYGVITGKDEAEWKSIFKFAKEMGIQTILSEPKTDQLDLVEKLADEYRINVAIHNHPKPSPYWSPDAVLAAVSGRSKRIGACADIGHWVRSGLNPVESMKKLEGRIIEFHFKDLNQKSENQAHDVIWGTGVCDIKALIKEMKRQKFKGAITVEYEYNWENSFPEISESLRNFTNITNRNEVLSGY